MNFQTRRNTLIIALFFCSNALVAETVSISALQGAGQSSPMVDQEVTISAIVTGDFQDNDADTISNLGGFYIQQAMPDKDAATSNGVFVADGKNPGIDVKVGDQVEVTGTVQEFYGETQIKLTAVKITGTGLIQATDVYLPTPDFTSNSKGTLIADLERYEGMLVRFPQQLTVTDLYYLGRFGEVALAQGGRPHNFTNNNHPDVAGYAKSLELLAVKTVILDDGMKSNNPSKLRHLNAGDSADYSIRSGDSATAITGVLRYSRGSGGSGNEGWRIEPTQAVVFKNDNPRPGAPDIAGSTRVASYNVLNFFSTLDDGKSTCGPLDNIRCRGANSIVELGRQLEKTVSALALMDADIIGMTELENNNSQSIVMIVDALNTRIGNKDYRFIDTGTIYNDVIKAGIIYKSSTIKTAGPFALLTSAVDPRFIDNKNRPALAQTFKVIKTGATFTVVLNHLKSKGSSCASIGDPNIFDGQGNCNLTRTKAAAALVDWIKTDPTASGDRDFLIMGDMNANIMEHPLTTFSKAGLTNLMHSKAESYSYRFGSQVGAIDHAFVSASLLPQVKETIEWHINADEPNLFDYNLEYGRDATLFDAKSPYRASDHDPVIIGLELTN